MRLRRRPYAGDVHVCRCTRRYDLALYRRHSQNHQRGLSGSGLALVEPLWNEQRTLRIARAALGIALLLFASPASAWTGSPTGTTFEVTYAEPTRNVAGGPPQLTKTTIYYRLGSGAESSIDVPASSPAGGKTVKRQLTVPILPGQAGTIYVQCTAWNASGESARTAVATKTADRR